MKPYRYFFLLSFLMLLGACTENLTVNNDKIEENLNDQAHQIDDIPNTGVSVTFSGSYATPEILTANHAKQLAQWEAITDPNSEVATRLWYNGANNNEFQHGLGLKLTWNSNDNVSVIQTAIKPDGSVALNSNGTLSKYDYYTTKNDVTTSPITSNTPVKWYKGAQKYKFFATYPTIQSEAQVKNQGYGIIALNPYIDGGKYDETNKARVTVRVNKNQKNNFWMLRKSNMFVTLPELDKNLYMVSESPYVAQNATVSLQFHPIMTSLVVAVKAPNNEDVIVKGVRVHLLKNGKRIPFPDLMTMDYQNMKYTKGGTKLSKDICNKIEEDQSIKEAGTTDYIDVLLGDTPYGLKTLKGDPRYPNINDDAQTGTDNPIVKQEGVPQNRIRVLAGHGLVLTAIVPPYVYAPGHYSLEVEVLYDNDTYARTVSVGNTSKNIIIPSIKVPFDLGRPVNKNIDWMGRLPENTFIRDLSIPGAHGSCQVLTGTGSTYAEAQRQAKQIASVTEMLNAGIRVLDLRPNYYWTRPTNVNHYGNINDKAYVIDTDDNDADITKDNSWYKHTKNVIRQIDEWLAAHPSETVIVMLTQENAHGQGGNTDGSRGAMKAIRNHWSGSRRAYFYKDITLQDARGKVILMPRPDYESINSGSRFIYFKDEEGSVTKDGYAYINKTADGEYWNGKNWTYDPQNNKYDVANSPYYGEFRNGKTYRSYKIAGGSFKDADSNPYAFKKAELTPYGQDAAQNKCTLYYLDREILGKRSGTNSLQQDGYTVSFQISSADLSKDGFPASLTTPYTGFGLYNMKAIAAIDFLHMAADNTYANDWFLTVVPGWAYTGIFTESSATYRTENSWANNGVYTATHSKVRDYLVNNKNRRHGIVLFDFAPGKDNSGKNFTYTYKYGLYNGSYQEFTNKTIGQEINQAIIDSNFARQANGTLKTKNW